MRLPNGYGSVVKLSGNRRKPYLVRKTVGWKFDPVTQRKIQQFIVIGTTATRSEGLQLLAEYNNVPLDYSSSKLTFEDVYQKWAAEKYPSVSVSSQHCYQAAYELCNILKERTFKDIKLIDLQYIVDHCGKNYPTLKKLKILFNQLYSYAMKHDICTKNYAVYVDIQKHCEKSGLHYIREKISQEEINRLWERQDDKYCQIILMLIYNGVRISEFLNLRKEDVHLEKRYFDVISSKTENGIRQVPIAAKVLPFYEEWYHSLPASTHLLHTSSGRPFSYRNFYDSYYKPIMQDLKINKPPHCCRHTCISLLAAKGIEQTIIKKIVGHSGSMSLTEKVYTHFDIQELIDAIDRI